MENPEEILHSLEEFSKIKPKDIPRELEEYLCFVAKTGNPVYQWPTIKSLFREKLLSVITEFYESCPGVDVPPCPNVEIFNYDLMKNFILEKLDTFAAAPFTVQRICELLTAPRKEYNRIDKYMRALEKNILVVSTTEPGRRSAENGDNVVNGIESEHAALPLDPLARVGADINVEEMDEFATATSAVAANSWPEALVSATTGNDDPFVSIEAVALNSASHQQHRTEDQQRQTVTITAVPSQADKQEAVVDEEASDGNKEGSETSEEKGACEEKREPEELIVDEKPSVEPNEAASVEIQIENETSIKPIEEDCAVEEGEDSPGIENISPENSASSPETLRIDVKTVEDRDDADREANEEKAEESVSAETEGTKWQAEEEQKAAEGCEDTKEGLIAEEEEKATGSEKEAVLEDKTEAGCTELEKSREDVKSDEISADVGRESVAEVEKEERSADSVENKETDLKSNEETDEKNKETEKETQDAETPMEVDTVAAETDKKEEETSIESQPEIALAAAAESNL